MAGEGWGGWGLKRFLVGLGEGHIILGLMGWRREREGAVGMGFGRGEGGSRSHWMKDAGSEAKQVVGAIFR